MPIDREKSLAVTAVYILNETAVQSLFHYTPAFTSHTHEDTVQLLRIGPAIPCLPHPLLNTRHYRPPLNFPTKHHADQPWTQSDPGRGHPRKLASYAPLLLQLSLVRAVPLLCHVPRYLPHQPAPGRKGSYTRPGGYM